MSIRSVRHALCFAIALGSATPALAEQLVVQTDRTQLVTLSVRPTTVVIGNPAIADVTVNGNQVFINGFTAGETNVIMLDEQGASIASLDVIVTQSTTARSAAVFSASGRKSMNCAPYCDPVLSVGDDDKQFASANNQYSTRRGLATASATPTTNTPPPAANADTPQ
jgi:Flp pilus assembly secretin CpaC